MLRDKRAPVQLIELHPIARRRMFTAAFSRKSLGVGTRGFRPLSTLNGGCTRPPLAWPSLPPPYTQWPIETLKIASMLLVGEKRRRAR